ncbi:hypothetical protein LXL04_005914 [Taraxacum kok-saghyz]
MASISSSCHTSSVTTVQENGSRNKRKFRADPPPPTTSQNLISPLQHECLSYEFSAEKFESTPAHSNGCDMCSFNHEQVESFKLDLGLACAAGGLGSGSTNRNTLILEAIGEFHDADWSDLTESELEELVLSNLDAMFKSAIKKIASFGYTEEVATKAVLRAGLCCGCKDTLSNIVENTLIYLRNKQEVDPLTQQHHFESLQQMEKYTLAELVCVVREVRPLFSTGDAMWCLLISDMNVSQACAIDGDGTSDVCSSKQGKPSETLPNLSSSSSSLSAPLEAPSMASIPCVHNHMAHTPPKTEPPLSNSKPKPPFVMDGLKGTQNSTSKTMTRSFSLEEKPIGSRKITGINKRDYILRQKSVHLDKTYRTHGLKGSSRSGKLGNIGGLILDKKLKSVSQSTQTILTSPSLLNTETSSSTPSLSTPPNTNITPETNLSLSLPVKTNTPTISFGQWDPQDKKDQAVLKLAPRVRELENQLHEWTEWANQKVMQAARRLGKDKTELKTLRQEKEEVERLKKEKQTLEENTMKKLSEMENALSKASSQVGRANSAVGRLEVENAKLRVEMEAAKLQAAESAASCQEVSKREKNTLMQLQLWEKHKVLFQEELIAEKRKLAQLQENLEVAKEQRDQLEMRWKQEEKAKEEIMKQAIKYKIERQEGVILAKSRELLTHLKADKNLKKYKDDIQKLEKEISSLRLKSDSSKIAALRNGKPSSPPETATVLLEKVTGGGGGVKRERECVMCLSEEMSVVFLPCAHQVVCVKCNEIHEKQGMKDCPSCRGAILRRIAVRYAVA